jgi:hypothetical protein
MAQGAFGTLGFFIEVDSKVMEMKWLEVNEVSPRYDLTGAEHTSQVVVLICVIIAPNFKGEAQWLKK